MLLEEGKIQVAVRVKKKFLKGRKKQFCLKAAAARTVETGLNDQR